MNFDVPAANCYEAYPGLANRSAFCPNNSVGSTIIFYVVEDTGSNLTPNVPFIETLARAPLKTYLPGSPGIGTKRVGQRTTACGTDVPKISPLIGGESVRRSRFLVDEMEGCWW